MNQAPKMTCAVAGRQPCVSESQEELDKEVSRFSDLAERLVGRLERVLRHNPPSGPPNQVEKESSGVPLADDLSNIAQRLRLQNDLLDRILERLEV
jgi:hypothetical protein